MIRAEDRDTPLLNSTKEVSSSEMIQFLTRSGLTMTRSSGWNSMKFTPPNVAAYWSWRPPPSPASIRSISNARCAISYSPSGRLSHSTNALTRETTMVEEVPRPEPGGASQKVVIRHGNGRPPLNWVTIRR